MPRSAPLFLLILVAACDGTRIRCATDADCPASLPFCLDGTCVDDAPAEGEGEGGGEGEGEGGEGEGEGEGGGEGEGEGDASCPAAGTPPARTADGPLVSGVTITATSPCQPDGEGVRVSFRYADAQADMWIVGVDSGPAAFVQSASFVGFPYVFQIDAVLTQTGDAAAGEVTVLGCVDRVDRPLAVWTADVNDNASNTVCAPVQ